MSDNEHRLSELTTNQRRALEALLSEPTVRAAAAACNLTERTLYRYLAESAFRAELHARQDDILAASTAALVGMSGDMLRELHRLAMKAESESVRARAIAIWARHKRETVELDALSERVRQLENRGGG